MRPHVVYERSYSAACAMGEVDMKVCDACKFTFGEFVVVREKANRGELVNVTLPVSFTSISPLFVRVSAARSGSCS